MALDFPNTPTFGQLFPSPPVAGLPVWQWDGSEWRPTSQPSGAGALTANVTVLSSGSGSYVTPAGTLWLRVRMVGGGSGGGGGGSTNPVGTIGTATTFGPHTANGGLASGGSIGGGSGGSGTIGAGAVGIVVNGGGGGGSNAQTGTNQVTSGGVGGSSMLGGGGPSPPYSSVGSVGNGPGGGGAGGGGGNAPGNSSGGGGGGGGGLDIIIAAPAVSYAYAVGPGGGGGPAGSTGFAGGNGAGGEIIVEAYGYFAGVADPGAVRFDSAQSLTTAQQGQARSNIGMAVGQITGTTGTTQPGAGTIGERITSTGNSAALTSTVYTTISTLVIPTSGVWDIDGYCQYGGPGATTSTDWVTVVGTTPASSSGIFTAHNRQPSGTDMAIYHAIPKQRITVPSGGVTYYMNAECNFSGSAITASGVIFATRVS